MKRGDEVAIYRNVQLSFWTDNKVEDEFTPEDKYFYLYLLTNPQTNICGCYEVSYSQLTNQTGYNKDTIIRLIERFENVHKVIKFNKETKEMLILNWYKYNWSKSEKTLRGVESVAIHIKCEEFRNYIVNMIDCIRNDTPYKGHTYPIQASVSDTDSDTDTVHNNINNIYKDNSDEIQPLPFDVEKVWKDTYKVYPKQSYSHSAKIAWLDLFKGIATDNQLNVAKMIVYAIQLYLDDYKKQNPDDETFRYVPRFDTWLKEDCMYWIGVYEEKARGK